MSWWFLCVAPLLVIGVVGPRALRIGGFYQAAGVVLFGVIAAAVWMLGGRLVVRDGEGRRSALAGILLTLPFAMIALLWVGLGTPLDATPAENQMRYLVLLASSVAVACGFVVMREDLAARGENFYSAAAHGFNLLAGASYVVWNSFETGKMVNRLREGQFAPAIVALSDPTDVLLFTACVLTYLATALFAVSLARTGRLGAGAARTYVGVCLVALFFILTRGVSFPDPNALSAPWYATPAFIAGIPAVPWIMPFLLGVVCLGSASADRSAVENP